MHRRTRRQINAQGEKTGWGTERRTPEFIATPPGSLIPCTQARTQESEFSRTRTGTTIRYHGFVIS